MIYIYIYIYNLPSWLLPICQWPHGNSCTWAHDIWLNISVYIYIYKNRGREIEEEKGLKDTRLPLLQSFFWP